MQVRHKKTKSKLSRKLALDHSKFLNRTRLGGLASLFGFASVSSLLILPLISATSAFADSLDYSVNVNTSLNVTVSTDTVSLTLNPSTNPFASTDLNVSVGTNNPWGYRLYLKADSTDLTNSTYSTPAYINTLSDTAIGTSTDFPVNEWGYRVSSLSSGNTADNSITDTTGTYFYPFVSDTLIGSTTTSVNNSISTLTFASKVDYERPAGTYTLDFSFRTVPTVTTLDMQDLDPTVCTYTPTIVTDSRDGQSYAIARISGTAPSQGEPDQCWMLQNLKLGKTQDNIVLTSTDSNVESNFTLSSNEAGAEGKFLNYYRTDDDIVGIGTKVYYMDKSEYYCSNMYGCYYNWYTATAGSGTGGGSTATGAGINVNYDICPAGWSLPTGGSSGDFQNLAVAYGYGVDSDSAVLGKLLVADPINVVDNVNGSYIPGFLQGGACGSGGCSLSGGFGAYQSRTAYSIGYNYGLFVKEATSDLNLLHKVDKSVGMAIRCLLQES